MARQHCQDMTQKNIRRHKNAQYHWSGALKVGNELAGSDPISLM